MSNLNLNTISSLDTGREVDVNRVMQTVDYVSGLIIDSRDTVIVDGDDRYVLAASTALPYTTSGAGMPEGGAFVSVGDAVLRQELGSQSGESSGAGIVGYRGQSLLEAIDDIKGDVNELKEPLSAFRVTDNAVSLPSVAALKSLPVGDLSPSLIYVVASFREGSAVGGGVFVWSPSSTSIADGGTVFEADNAEEGRFLRSYDGPLRAEFFGAEPWAVGDTHDSTEAFQKCARAAGECGVWKFSGRHRILDTVWIPSRQTFGGDSQILSPWRHLMSDPLNFQGANTGRDLLGDSVFFDAVEGDCFILGEGACPNNFSVYGKGLNTLGLDMTGELAVGVFYNTTAFRFGKFIKPKNIDVSLFRYAFWSKETNHEEGLNGVPVSGNYYSYFDNVSSYFCHSFFLQSDEISYNMTWNNVKTANTQVAFNTATRVSNFVIISGSFEGFGSEYCFAYSYESDLTFIGCYFEKYNGLCHNLFAITGGDSSITVANCTIFLNYIRHIFNITVQGSGVTVSKNNIFRISPTYGDVKPTLYRLGGTISPYGITRFNRLIGDPENVKVYSNMTGRFVEYDIGA